MDYPDPTYVAKREMTAQERADNALDNIAKMIDVSRVTDAQLRDELGREKAANEVLCNRILKLEAMIQNTQSR